MQSNTALRTNKRLPAKPKQQLFQLLAPDTRWSLDFLNSSLCNGKTYSLLYVVDDFNGHALAIEADTSLSSLRVIKLLEKLKIERGLPQRIRFDNGAKFISPYLDQWLRDNKLIPEFIQVGQHTQTVFIEKFNASICRELLNRYVFRTINEVNEITFEWMMDYNLNRHHNS